MQADDPPAHGLLEDRNAAIQYRQLRVRNCEPLEDFLAYGWAEADLTMLVFRSDPNQ